MKISEHVYFYQAEETYPELKLKKYERQIRPSNSVVIKDEYQILIDPGFLIENKLDNLIRKLAEDNLDLKETKEIWLTHFHYDHAQAVKKLVDFTRAKICCHELAKDFLENPMTPENLISLIEKASSNEDLSTLPRCISSSWPAREIFSPQNPLPGEEQFLAYTIFRSVSKKTCLTLFCLGFRFYFNLSK